MKPPLRKVGGGFLGVSSYGESCYLSGFWFASERGMWEAKEGVKGRTQNRVNGRVQGTAGECKLAGSQEYTVERMLLSHVHPATQVKKLPGHRHPPPPRSLPPLSTSYLHPWNCTLNFQCPSFLPAQFKALEGSIQLREGEEGRSWSL